jgi:hypothetical protein
MRAGRAAACQRPGNRKNVLRAAARQRGKRRRTNFSRRRPSHLRTIPALHARQSGNSLCGERMAICRVAPGSKLGERDGCQEGSSAPYRRRCVFGLCRCGAQSEQERRRACECPRLTQAHAMADGLGMLRLALFVGVAGGVKDVASDQSDEKIVIVRAI